MEKSFRVVQPHRTVPLKLSSPLKMLDHLTLLMPSWLRPSGSRLIPLVLLTLAFWGTPQKALAWGSRGHSTICEAAVHLVKNKELKGYLMGRIQAVTYLCNIPDTHWRSLKEASSGTSTHFFETDHIDVPFEKIPLDFKKVEELAKTKINLLKNKPIRSAAKDLGSNWWRAHQFYQRALSAAKLAAEKKPQSTHRGTSVSSSELFEMVAMMGLMGHFIGDNAQPLHNTSNYDGWQNGHGGLHGYFESDIVNQLPSSLLNEITKAAPQAVKEFKFEIHSTLLEQMRKLSVLSYSDLKNLWKLDPVLKASNLNSRLGLELKTPAERKDPEKIAPQFQKLIVTQMARAAVLLAKTWDDIYEKAGRPDLKHDRSFDFPHQYPFVAPDYISENGAS